MPDQPALQIAYRDPKTLSLGRNLARHHPQRQIRKLRHSLREFGFINPLIIDEQGAVLCGAGRLLAANAEGLAQVPTICLSHMSEAQRLAYILADNRIAEEARWDKAMLRGELQGLIDLGYEVELTGFDTIEIDTLLTIETSPAKDDDVVELPAERAPVVCRLGDCWHIGEHRLLIGDARERASYERLLGSEKAQLILTDPPYGCRIAGNVSGLGAVRHDDFVMGATGKLDSSFSFELLRPAFKCMRDFAQTGAIAFVFIDWRGARHLLDAADGVFEELKNLIVWHKTNPGMGAFYRSAHELIYCFKVSRGQHINNIGLGKRSNVWTYAGANVFRAGRMEDLVDHPTVKPKKMLADAILDCSTRGSIVLDGFAGSGATLVAAAMTGRRGFGVELDPKYGDVMLRRLAAETGLEPLLDGNASFSVIAAERIRPATVE